VFKRSTALFVGILAVLLALGSVAALAADAPTSGGTITDQVSARGARDQSAK